jgi:hypothetical protein
MIVAAAAQGNCTVQVICGRITGSKIRHRTVTWVTVLAVEDALAALSR